jgi:cation-transporting P-type ATPase E
MADSAASAPAAGAAPVTETPAAGLTSAQVAERRSRGLGNTGGERVSRSVAEILRANILTRFNFILGVLLAVILAVGEPQDALFGIVLVANALIGIAQELRAKATLDRLAVLSAPRVRVTRDGAPQEIAVAELVAGDLVGLRPGDQLVADGVVREAASLEADESLLTGESEPAGKRAGDRLLSGSFVVAGSGSYQATEVGAEAYARRLATEARRFALVRSELMDGINRILRYVTWAIVPVAALLIVSQLHVHDTVQAALTATVAGLVAMVPQGLVLPAWPSAWPRSRSPGARSWCSSFRRSRAWPGWTWCAWTRPAPSSMFSLAADPGRLLPGSAAVRRALPHGRQSRPRPPR